MFRQILITHVRWTRNVVLGAGLLNLLLPVAIWNLSFIGGISPMATPYVRGFENLGPIAIFFACVAGFAIAVLPWTIDAQARHVYPLALPIAWTRYVAYRFTAGALMVLVTGVVALLLSMLYARLMFALIEAPALRPN